MAKKLTHEEIDRRVREALESPLPTAGVRRQTSGALKGLVNRAREKRGISPRGS